MGPFDADATRDPNLYVQGLPASWTESNIQDFFSEFGPVASMKVFSALPGKNTQCCMIRMASVEAAEAAISTLNGACPPNESMELTVRYADTKQDKMRKQLGPRGGPAPFNRGAFMPQQSDYPRSFDSGETPNDNLYVKGVPLVWDENALRAHFSQFGTVVNVKLLVALEGAASQGGLVRMSSVEEATYAKQSSDGFIPNGAAISLHVRFADTPQDKVRRASRGSTAPTQRFSPYAITKMNPGMLRMQNLGGPSSETWHGQPVVSMNQQLSGYAAQSFHGNGQQHAFPPDVHGFSSVDMQNSMSLMGNAHGGASSLGQSKVAQGGASATVCITNLPGNIDELSIIKSFSPFGAITSSTLLQSGPTQVALITYADVRGAWAAVESMNGQLIGLNVISACIKVGV